MIYFLWYIVEDPAIKDLLIELQNEEYKHRQLIEKKIAELTKC